MNLLVATLAAPLATAALGALPGPRRPKEAVFLSGIAVDLRALPRDRRGLPRGQDARRVRRCPPRRRAVGARPRPDRVRRRAVGPVLRGLPGAERALGLLLGEAAHGAPRPRPRLPRGDAPRRRVQQPRRPVDRGRGDDPRVGLPRRVPEPGHVARGGLEVPRARQRGARLRASRHGAPLRRGRGSPRREGVRPRLDRLCRALQGAAPVHREARRRLPADRLRDEGRARTDAHVEARRVPRGAFAGRCADGGRHDELLALRPAQGPPGVARRPRPGLLGRDC